MLNIIISITSLSILLLISTIYFFIAYKNKDKFITSFIKENGTGKEGVIFIEDYPWGIVANLEVEELKSAGRRTKVLILNISTSGKHAKKGKLRISDMGVKVGTKIWQKTENIQWLNNWQQTSRRKKLNELLLEKTK